MQITITILSTMPKMVSDGSDPLKQHIVPFLFCCLQWNEDVCCIILKPQTYTVVLDPVYIGSAKLARIGINNIDASCMNFIHYLSKFHVNFIDLCHISSWCTIPLNSGSSLNIFIIWELVSLTNSLTAWIVPYFFQIHGLSYTFLYCSTHDNRTFFLRNSPFKSSIYG